MNRSKQKGTVFESAVRDFLNENGFPAVERRTLNGAQDRGDISGITGWVLECKNTKTISLAAAVDEAETEARNARAIYFAAIVKRPRKGGAAEAYAVMPFRQLVQIITALRG